VIATLPHGSAARLLKLLRLAGDCLLEYRLPRAILPVFRFASLAKHISSRFTLAKRISSRPGLAKCDSSRAQVRRTGISVKVVLPLEVFRLASKNNVNRLQLAYIG
jgi:hypothetical protein